MFYKEKLKFLRERIGITQEQVGNLINVDRKTYSHYENEDIIISIKHLNTICNYFDVSLDYIFNFNNNLKYEKSKLEINKELSGKRLKEFRKNNKLTQKDLAKILNIGQSTIAEYERGTNIIATPFLYTICKKYQISADYLLGKTN